MTRRRPIPVAALLAAALLLACARDYPPSGGEPDRTAPQVVGTRPATMEVVPGWDRPVVIRFDERLSERGIEQAVTVSPETGAVRVDKGRSELRISVEGGWRRGQIYRIVVLPVVRDLHGNERREATDLVFSTGPPIPSTAVAGLVADRITGRPVPDARVEATRRADSVVYVAKSDTAGFFALRHIPAGAYDVKAYLDRIPNRRVDFGEPVDSGAAALGVTDTAVVSFSLLPGDTTPARLVRAEAPDSGHVRLHLDEEVNPEEPLDDVAVQVLRLPDSAAVAVATVMHAYAYERIRAERLAAAAEAAADSAAQADTAAAAGADAARARPPTRPGARDAAAGAPAAADTAAPLPSRELVVVPAEPLPPETRFVVTVDGVRNLRGLVGGGGSAEFTTPKRPEAPAADTVPAAARDTVPAASTDGTARS